MSRKSQVKAADARWRVDALTASDRFGDYGLVGVAITNRIGDVCEIDSFLLSCRVIGRSVETALLSYVAREAASGGMRIAQGMVSANSKERSIEGFLLEARFQDDKRKRRQDAVRIRS